MQLLQKMLQYYDTEYSFTCRNTCIDVDDFYSAPITIVSEHR